MKKFFSRSRIAIAIVLVLFVSVFACFQPDWMVSPANARTNHVESLQDKMVHYMKSRNKDIPDIVAYKLANAIVTQKYKYNIPIEIQLAQATVESNFDQYALGKDGELGFFQVHPKWHADKVHTLLRSGDIKTKNIYDSQTNVAVAMSILHDCEKKHRSNIQRTLTCYNGAGASAIEYSKHVLVVEKEVKKWL